MGLTPMTFWLYCLIIFANRLITYWIEGGCLKSKSKLMRTAYMFSFSERYK